MPNLEDMQPGEITPVEIAALVGRPENQRLEFKQTIGNTTSYELAKDLASIGNADGGCIVIGAVQDKKTERCTGFRPVQNLAGEMKKVRDVAATNIEKPLSLIPIAATAPGGEPVILVFVPKSTSLLAVTTNKKAEFWKRIGTDKREMTYAEIEQARTLGYEAAEQDRKRQRSLAPNLTRWNEINDVDLLRQLMSQRFRGAIESERWLRMTATPLQLTTDRVDTGNDSLRSTIQFPVSGQRDTGWFLGIGAGLRQVFPTPLGFESKESSQAKEIPPSIVLTRSGHFEFAVPLFPWICFGQRDRRDLFEARPYLWPMAVVEFPLSFLIFVKNVYKQIEVPGAFVASVEYINLSGSVLQAGTPYGMPFFDGPYEFQDQD